MSDPDDANGPSAVASEPPPAAPPNDGAAAAPLFDSRRLLISSALGVVALVALVAAIGYWLREPLLEFGAAFVTRFGGPGIAIGFALPDAFTIPLPNDTFLALGLAGGMDDLPLIAWGTLGSIMGGSVGWLLGRLLRRTAWLARFFAGRGAGLDTALRRHGIKVVAIAAVTPLPYSVSAWAAGSTLMPYRTFAAVSLLRVVRVVMSLYLIHLGLAASS